MKQYKRYVIVCLVSVAVILVGIMTILEVFTRQILIPSDVVAQKEVMVKQKRDQIEVVSIGDSHVMNGMDIRDDDFFNYGISGEPVPLGYFKTKWLIENVKDLDTLLLQLDYHIFSYYRTTDVGHLAKQYRKYIDEDVSEELGDYPSAQDFFENPFYSLQVNYRPIVLRTFFEYLQGDELHRPNIQDNGVITGTDQFTDRTPEKRQRIAQARVNHHLYNNELIIDGMVDYYEKLIKLAQDNGIEVVLIRYPLANEYLQLIDEDVEAKFAKTVEEITSQYDVRILDYRNVFTEKQDYFSNEDHLNQEGATKLGEIVKQDLDRDWE
ncbi:hypothetical protein V7138_13045 [Bacillus sp. JJ1533]|uniref:hypothetical protein n=1 Tax=Bacillus sp. JJ1533 TaxID=3122959 RepID=UPI0030001623